MSKLIIVALVLVFVLAVAAVAYAVPQSVIDAIIADAEDNLAIDGDWTAEEIEAALAYLRDNPLYEAYADYEGVLEEYLAGLQDPGVAGADELAFTGAEIFLLIGAGAGLAGSGALLRRRRD